LQYGRKSAPQKSTSFIFAIHLIIDRLMVSLTQISNYITMADRSDFPLLELSVKTWDVIVIGGGATGCGIALDASSRGFKTLLLEQADFGKGTSSRSTKLLHGGVRYLAQGNISLVMEALKERGIIFKNAPHLARNLEFIIPVYTWLDAIRYSLGLKLYDMLAGRRSLGKSRFINPATTLSRLPLLKHEGLKGGVIYHDGQFDDCRLLLALIHSIADHGGTARNYCQVTGLLKDNAGKVTGVRVKDQSTATEMVAKGRLVINATGIFADDILRMDHPVIKRTIRPSQGVHLVFERSFLEGDSALMIPKTEDGRVLFAIPWYDKVVAGTTDTPVEKVTLEPKALEDEISFILLTAGKYFIRKPVRNDILCVFAGLRPLAASPGDPVHTREISRRHKITVSASGLVTVEGGKWTIYRKMAQDTLHQAMRAGLIEKRPCLTLDLPLNGYEVNNNGNLTHTYGSHAAEILRMTKEHPGWARTLHLRLSYTEAEIRWICRNEMPVKLEDLMARRTRALILDAAASREMAAEAASIMAEELGKDKHWRDQEIREYSAMVENYLC
jgi:glycerol-3-phosphate dehydrogenase